MSQSSRPRTHAEREQILRALTDHLSSADADPTVTDLHNRVFASAAAAYTEAREGWLTAHGAWQSASVAAEEADTAFDNSLRRLMLSLRESSGKADHELHRALLGGMSPSELMALRYAEEVTRARAFLTRLDARPDLSPSDERKATFTAATDALELASGAVESALRARLVAGEAQDLATTAFDAAWGKLVRALRAVVDESVSEALIPRFTRGEAAAPEAEAAPA